MLIIRNLNLISVQSWTYLAKKAKKQKQKRGVLDLVLERTCPEKYPKSEKSVFVSFRLAAYFIFLPLLNGLSEMLFP